MNASITGDSEPFALANGDGVQQPLWYAAYTSARHEKRVAEHLRQREVECFLPLYETVHRWNNGRHRVQLPLFPGYIFVHMSLRDKLRVLQVPGLAHLISFNGVPVVLPEAKIVALRDALTAGVSAQPYRYLSVGARVEICRGPLQGMKGILLRHHSQFRVVLSVEMIMRSIVVEIEAADVIALGRVRPIPSSVPASQSVLGVCA